MVGKSIVEFGHTKLNWLRNFPEFENETPSEDCIAWVISETFPTKIPGVFYNLDEIYR
uniref:Uncharacterized protein n=1 Tax=Candidatus Kentrum eta TaxID=2126337 RepID=A0A450VDJ5_9GAMM|nr:MAG: hypothetical protein BECKH772B_GA0070898_103113 [Candidatus Kentron sp. H]VFK03161.1 MAG: hypothetical protein BECKH772A_GA0070896_103093 [Candidatus Kentron sp. H]VFK06694.1 MAG: hypothetical protein BECKH772C_GA0070978_103691 [Candidatus Kentron sp. H]